jgi:hypothetical protein
MASKVQAGRRGWELEPVSSVITPLDPELEAEIEAISVWFEALSGEWKAYFDHEARCGREAYACL